MLQLIDVKKDYYVAGEAVHALKGISLNFRRNEFVSILGASGCGKTTLLNIIGGLDKYTSGDLLIEGVSTRGYNDRDWDTYRNHSIGFIFQSYHLIPHQTVLQNVELALMISGVGKEERRRRAIEALDKVGLKDKINNRPNQLSGGQAQRVAIARALINDPEVVLADEPTGALDSKTSVQIMELLKEISKDRLVIMVTHNPELAEQYSTRIIRLLDGLIIDDSMPYVDGEEEPSCAQSEGTQPITNKGRKKKSSMSFGMAFGLSLKNLLSKSKRTTMVSVAGSIGIIGVSMVLAISAGVQNYIKSMEDDMLSGYPLTVTETALDFESLMNFSASGGKKPDITRLDDKVYVDSLIETLMGMSSTITLNNITENYIDYVRAMPEEYYNALQFDYGIEPAHNIYTNFRLDSSDEGEEVSVTGIRAMYTGVLAEVAETTGNDQYKQFAAIIPTVDTFSEMPDNYEYVLSQYDIIATNTDKTEGFTADELKELFESKDSLIMVIDDGATTDLTLGQMGYFTQEEFLAYAERAKDIAEGVEDTSEYDSLLRDYLDGKEYDYFLDKDGESTFKWYPNDTVYAKTSLLDGLFVPGEGVNGGYNVAEYKYNAYASYFAADRDTSDDVDLKVKVILQKKSNISYGCLMSGIYYTNALTRHALETGMESKIAAYINSQESGRLDGMPYKLHYTYNGTKHETQGLFYTYDNSGMISGMFGMGDSDEYANYRIKLSTVGASDLPKSFAVYPLNFDSKDLITDYLDEWNAMCRSGAAYNGITLDENDVVDYTDNVGLIITMINTMIQMITIALIAFTALSLIVSTVMIGIITYVSVVERIKEIGILRSVGARKKDIKRLFNAETFIIGLSAGIVGILITYFLSLIINLIVGALAGIAIAALPWWQALIMICISVALTLVSGLIPASAAAKKDPVVALRTE